MLKQYKIKHTVEAITKWLKRNNFVYKKPKPVPSKLYEQKQEHFIEYYNELKQDTDNVVIIFMDAVLQSTNLKHHMAGY
ncbi:MAG: hypothetical protein RLZZ293_208 [Pseudomonadota bacterium]